MICRECRKSYHEGCPSLGTLQPHTVCTCQHRNMDDERRMDMHFLKLEKISQRHKREHKAILERLKEVEEEEDDAEEDQPE